MSILNYTTQIAAEKTVTEIQQMLARAKAQAILTEYDPEGVLCAISFRVLGPWGVMSFRLPASIEKIFAVIVRDKRITPKLRTKEQAARVAWRIVKDWLEAQLAMIRAEMATLEQVFLPYAQNAQGVTLFETLTDQKFSGLALQN